MIELTRSLLATGVMAAILLRYPQPDAAVIALLGTGFAAIAVPTRRGDRR
ncbi:hypothetical protein OG196_31755 [Kitasatospora purpeofusca]|nr:hypothetical protein OG196_31755 [Kitasatospora purpeofusca]